MGFERRSFDCFSFGKAYIISGENVRFKYERQVGLHPFHRIRLAKAEQVGVTGRIHLPSFAGVHRPHWSRPRSCYHQEFQGSLARVAIPWGFGLRHCLNAPRHLFILSARLEVHQKCLLLRSRRERKDIRAIDLSHPTTPEVTQPNGTPVKKKSPHHYRKSPQTSRSPMVH